jgi:heme oxygenase
MTPRAALRAGTAAEHERVDALFGALNLAAEADYRRFLAAQAAAFLPVEQAIDDAGGARVLADWPGRRRSDLLRQDLAALGLAPPPAQMPPRLDTIAAALGAVYVLEGSRLGGALLKRSVAPAFPRAFLDAQQPPGAWRKLLETLDDCLYETAAVEAAVGAARQTFRCFEAGGLRVLESRVS